VPKSRYSHLGSEKSSATLGKTTHRIKDDHLSRASRYVSRPRSLASSAPVGTELGISLHFGGGALFRLAALTGLDTPESRYPMTTPGHECSHQIDAGQSLSLSVFAEM